MALCAVCLRKLLLDRPAFIALGIWTIPGTKPGGKSLHHVQNPPSTFLMPFPHCHNLIIVRCFQISFRKGVAIIKWGSKDSLGFACCSRNPSLSIIVFFQVAQGKETSCQCRRCGFDSCVGKIPRRRKWQPTPVFLPGESPGQRSLLGYRPWDHKQSNPTEHTHVHCYYYIYKAPQINWCTLAIAIK